MNMLLCKTQSKGNLIQKILKGQLIPTASPDQLLIITDNSIEIQLYAFDDILSQYTTSTLLHQSFPFHILDSAIISSNLLLLTVCGLLLFKYSTDNDAFMPIDHIRLNQSNEQRDLIMYLKVSQSGEMIIAYSNTNMFFLYSIKNNKLIRINNELFITKFNICKVFVIKLLNASYGVFILNKNDKKYEFTSLYTDMSSEYPRVIHFEEYYSKEMKQTFLLMNTIKDEIQRNSNLDVYDFVFSTKLQFVFLISESAIIIHKVISSNMLESVAEISFKTPKYYVSSVSLLKGEYFQLMFDTQLYLFKVNDNDIKICSITPKENKRKVKGMESIVLIQETFTVLYYDFNSSMYFTQFTPSTIQEVKEVGLKLIGENVNQSVCSFDSTVIQNEDRHCIYSVCGLKGSSKLIQYEDALIETKLKEMHMLNVNNVFLSGCDDNKLCVMSYIDKASLFTLKKDFSINFIKDYDDIIIDMYAIPMSDNRHVLVFKRSIAIIHLITKNNSVSIKSEVVIPLNSKETLILSSVYYTPTHLYLITYMVSNHIVISSIDSKYSSIKEHSRLNLGEDISISSLCSYNSQLEDTLSFIIGTYQSYFQVIHFNLKDKTFNILKENKYDIVPDGCTDRIITESIKSIDDYVFISTRTGEFCVLKHNQTTKRMECLLSNKFTTNSLCLDIANVEKTTQGYSLDLFNELAAYNLIIDTNASKKVYKRKYIIKRNEAGIISENNAIVFFKKMTIDTIPIHLYLNGSNFSFGYFSNPTKNKMIINDIMYFSKTETARRIVSVSNDILIILTDGNKLYIYSPKIFKCISEVTIDSTLVGLTIHSMKSTSITPPNNTKVINCICLCGEYHDDTANGNKGILFIYEYNDSKAKLNVIAKIPKFPKPIYDVCCTKDYFITGMEGYICLLQYDIDSSTNSIIVRKEAKQQQFLNRIVSLYPINTNQSNIVLVGDNQESFQLIDVESTQCKLDVIAADLSNRSLAKAVSLDNIGSKVMLIEKNGSLSLFKLTNDLYEQCNSIDMKEYVGNVHKTEDGYICTGLCGSLFIFKEFSERMAIDYGLTSDRPNALYEFQKEVIKRVSEYYFGYSLPIEKMMQMSCPMKNVILIDLLESLCKYHSYLVKNISEYDELYKLLLFLKEEVI